jgi:hypothetical protein
MVVGGEPAPRAIYAAAMSDTLPTPRTTLRCRYVRVLVWCKSCRHQADADLEALVTAGRGDVPLVQLRFRCTRCRSRLTDSVAMAKDSGVVPWRSEQAPALA